MKTLVFSAFIFFAEMLACYFYFEFTFRPKRKLPIRILVYLAAGILQFGGSLINLPAVNLVAFTASISLIVWLLYKTNFRNIFFQTILMSLLMLSTEFVSIYLIALLMKASLDTNKIDFVVMILQGFFSKLLFFLSLYTATRIVFRHEPRKDKWQVIALVLFPVSSIILLCTIYDLATIYDIRDYSLWFMTGSILLLISNMIVFIVYETTQKVNFQNTQLQLALQKEKISSEYYGLLQAEYENSRILAHDIKGHLRVIQGMTADNRGADVGSYIDALYDDFLLNEKVAYSGNPVVDVIMNRYAQYCREQNIQLDLDISRASLEFLSVSEITALLDNLLSNAVEAAGVSTQKRIELIICEQNVNFVAIRLCNTSDIAPKVRNGVLVSQKKAEGMHGFGLKSIKRIAARYGGEVQWNYKQDSAEFELSVILKKK